MRLGGAPGVHTARFAGDNATYADNGAKTLSLLGDVAEPRTARFRTVAMVVWPDGRELAVEGVCEGEIAVAERGANGFGYDPVFVPIEGDGRSFAEMSDDEKHAISAPRPGDRAPWLLRSCIREEKGLMRPTLG